MMINKSNAEKRIRRCTRCANACPLTEPRCKTGEELAETGGVYEPVPEREGLLKRVFSAVSEKRKYKSF